MYNDIAGIYDEIFPLNQDFITFIPDYLGGSDARILDLGCGPGDYIDVLSRDGYQATGIDPSTEMIRTAQREKQGTFFNFGFSSLYQLDGPYDCIFSIGNSLSYHPDDQMETLYQDLCRLLNPGGTLVLQVVNWDRLQSGVSPGFGVKTLADGRTFHRSYQSGPDSSVIFHTELRIGDETLKAWSAFLYPKYSRVLRQGIQGVGLTVLNIFGDFQQSAYEALNSPAMILTARKAES